MVNSILNELKLLYVEDDSETREELSRFLRRRVGKLSTEKNGSDALNNILGNSYDMIITDLRMPFMDGIELIKELRRNGIETPVIITSAFSDSETILEAMDLGVVKYCVKPLKTDELLQTMEKIAADIMKKRGLVVLPSKHVIERSQKVEIEKSITSEVAHFIKASTGKGPKKVQAFISSQTIEIKICEALTQFETSLLADPSNVSLVSYVRKTFYNGCKSAFSDIILRTTGERATIIEVKSEPQNDTDVIIMEYVQ